MSEKSVLYTYQGGTRNFNATDVGSQNHRYTAATHLMQEAWNEPQCMSFGIRTEWRVQLTCAELCLINTRNCGEEYFRQNNAYVIQETKKVSDYKKLYMNGIKTYVDTVFPGSASSCQKRFTQAFAYFVLQGLVSRPLPNYSRILLREMQVFPCIRRRYFVCSPYINPTPLQL